MGTVYSPQWGSAGTSPQIRLTCSTQKVDDKSVKLWYSLYYVASLPVETSVTKAWRINVGGSVVASGNYGINGKTGTHLIYKDSIVVNKTTAVKNVVCYGTMDIKVTWNDEYRSFIQTGTDIVKIEALPSFSVTYNANGGTGAPAAQTKYYGIDSTISHTVPTKNEYTFRGWAVKERNYPEIVYRPGDTNGYDGNQSLEAQWRKWIKLTFSSNGGSGSPSEITYTVDNDVTSHNFTIPSTTPTRTGYTFQGWSIPGKSTVYPGETITLSTSTTATAVWNKLTYSVIYDANGGEGSISSQTKTYGVNLTLTSTIPTRRGYKFLGWATSRTATEPTYLSGGTYTSNSNLTLYAVWERLTNAHINYASKYRKGNLYVRAYESWLQGVPYVWSNGEWLKGGL